MSRRIVRATGALVLATGLVGLALPSAAADPSGGPASSAPSAIAPASPLASPIGPSDPQVPHDVARLEALLPDAVNGTPLFKSSFGPPTWARLGSEGTASVVGIVDAFDRQIDDLNMAFANDPNADTAFNLFVIEVAGVSGDAVAQAYGDLAARSEANATLTPSTLGGVPVLHLSAPDNQLPNVWFLGVDGVMLGIQTATEDQAVQLLGLLPTSVPAASAPAASAPAASAPVASPSAAP